MAILSPSSVKQCRKNTTRNLFLSHSRFIVFHFSYPGLILPPPPTSPPLSEIYPTNSQLTKRLERFCSTCREQRRQRLKSLRINSTRWESTRQPLSEAHQALHLPLSPPPRCIVAAAAAAAALHMGKYLPCVRHPPLVYLATMEHQLFLRPQQPSCRALPRHPRTATRRYNLYRRLITSPLRVWYALDPWNPHTAARRSRPRHTAEAVRRLLRTAVDPM